MHRKFASAVFMIIALVTAWPALQAQTKTTDAQAVSTHLKT
jgi:hypothetical protein